MGETIDTHVYQSREFCKDVSCSVQLELDKYEKGNKEYNNAKSICKTDCRHTKEQFIHWLSKHKYRLEGFGSCNGVCAGETAYEFHDWLQEKGIEIVR